MTFTDDDLKRLKEKMPNLNLGNPLVLERHQAVSLLARLEAAENAVESADGCDKGEVDSAQMRLDIKSWRKWAGK
jgi:hypothetical protein